MTNNFLIRKLTLADLNEFFILRLESLQDSPHSFLSSYEDEKKSGPDFYENILKKDNIDNVIFGAFVEDQLVGIVGIYQSKFRRLKHKANLWGAYVKSDKRGMGIAKQLMLTAINHARDKMNCILIILCVRTNNDAARKLYQSLGFVKWGTEPKSILIDDKFFDEDHMILML